MKVGIACYPTVGGSGTVATELARQLGIGARSLERGFREHVGSSPKAFARTLRFQAARRALAVGHPASEVAIAAGYADQPHMVREFRALSGTTPSAS